MITLKVTFRQPGFHNWPNADKVCPARAHLALRHRHDFHFLVEARVEGADREVELQTMQSLAKEELGLQYARTRQSLFELEFKANSVEMIATYLLEGLRQHVSQVGWTAVECWEDGEVGARVEKERER